MCYCKVRLIARDGGLYVPEIQLFEVWLIVPRDLSAYESKRTENNSKVNIVKVTMNLEGAEHDDNDVLAQKICSHNQK